MSKHLSKSMKSLCEKLGFYELDGYERQYIYNPKEGIILRAISPRSMKELKPWIGVNDGYRTVKLKVGHRRYKNVKIHRLAARFLHNEKHKRFIHHIDGDKLNNRLENLIFVTSQEHGQLHALLRSGPEDEYMALIAKIKEDNRNN